MVEGQSLQRTQGDTSYQRPSQTHRAIGELLVKKKTEKTPTCGGGKENWKEGMEKTTSSSSTRRRGRDGVGSKNSKGHCDQGEEAISWRVGLQTDSKGVKNREGESGFLLIVNPEQKVSTPEGRY